jgi:hypothetical protein
LTYVIDNKFKIINTMFLNMNLEKFVRGSGFVEVSYQSLLGEQAVCDSGEYGEFKEVLSSSRIIGYKRIESYFVRAVSQGETSLIECGFIDGDCTCSGMYSDKEEISFRKCKSSILNNYTI